MFQHILFPTDGEAPSNVARDKCLAFALDAGARVTALHVTKPFHVLGARIDMLEDTPDSYVVRTQARARDCLEPVATAARRIGVTCDKVALVHEHPDAAIVEVARERGCDLIAMASHGRRGIQFLVLGSVTQKVLVHSRVPVLVYR